MTYKPGGRPFDSPDCGSVPSRPRAVGSVPSFPLGAGPLGMDDDFGAGAVDIGDAPFFRAACLAAGSGSALAAGAAQKVAATISADNCRLFMLYNPSLPRCTALLPSLPDAAGSTPRFPLGAEAAANASAGAVPVGIEPDGGALSAALTAWGINPALRGVGCAGVATAAAGARATPPTRAAAGEAPGAEAAPPPEIELCSAADCCGRPAVPEAPANIAPPAAPVRLASRSDDCSPLARSVTSMRSPC